LLTLCTYSQTIELGFKTGFNSSEPRYQGKRNCDHKIESRSVRKNVQYRNFETSYTVYLKKYI